VRVRKIVAWATRTSLPSGRHRKHAGRVPCNDMLTSYPLTTQTRHMPPALADPSWMNSFIHHRHFYH